MSAEVIAEQGPIPLNLADTVAALRAVLDVLKDAPTQHNYPTAAAACTACLVDDIRAAIANATGGIKA